MTHWTRLSIPQRERLWAEEDDAEMMALDYGIRRFKEACASQPMSRWPAARTLIATSIDEVSAEIERAKDAIVEGRAMTGAKAWGHVFLYLEADVMAVAAIACMLDAAAMATGGGLAATASRIGAAIEMETQYTVLKTTAPRLKAVMERRIKKWDRRSLGRAMKVLGGQTEHRWTTKVRNAVGAKLLEIVVKKSGVFTIFTSWSNRRAQRKLSLSDEARAHLLRMNEHLEIMSPMFQPMVVPPNDWKQGVRGGYRLLTPYHTLVKPSAGAPAPLDDHGDMVYGAVNALQKTGWRVNPVVLATMQQIWAAGGGRAGLPTQEDAAIPDDFPVDGTEEEKVAWKARAAKIHGSNARLVGKRLAFLQCLALAERHADKVFYYPYSCDFRGRIYPVPQFLQPQGNDVARGLLTFADAKPLGLTGMHWLLIQYANCWGVDKMSFDDRVDWANGKLLGRRPSFDPLRDQYLWADADDPWQALATVNEIIAARDGDPTTYECSLPVNVDGSNSGLQHFSAMLRDPVGARLVNLEPGESPSDIYSDVAVSVRRLVEEDSKSGVSPDTTIDDLPEQWLKQDINRKLCKRGTMTFCYGVTQQGLKNALVEDGFVDWADNQFAAVQYIGKIIWAGICENITGATEVMDWLRKAAVCGNKANMLMEWRTPSGFHVAHPYNDPYQSRVTCLSGEVYFNVYDPDRGVRASKQASSLPPNFVHSLDACHLMMTVAAGSATGITHWMMIHDSFGTHACDVDHLNLTLREEFVKLYEINVLEQFRAQVIEQTGHDPGPPPARGTFDLARVLDSPYFFA